MVIGQGSKVRIVRGPHKGAVGTVEFGRGWMAVDVHVEGTGRPCERCDGTGVERPTVFVWAEDIEEVLL